MKNRDLIAQLQKLSGDATPYVQVTDPETGIPLLVAVTGVSAGDSETYGTAAINELED